MNPIRRFYWLSYSLVVIGWAYLWSLWVGLWNNSFPAFCGFKTITGLPCPSCGSTRSVVGMLHGDWDAVFVYNPLGWVTILLLILFSFLLMWDILSRKRITFHAYSLMEQNIRQTRWLNRILIGLILLNWLWTYHKGL